jgi:lysophospholipase L1-like esterase
MSIVGRTGRVYLSNRALLIGSILLALLLAEGAVRVLLPPPPEVRVRKNPLLDARLDWEKRRPAEIRLPPGADPHGGFYVRTPTGRRLRANTHVVIENHPTSHRSIDLRTNAFGFRNPEIAARTMPRVLFLGDSVTLSDYLPEEETFVRRVEALALARGKPLEAINAGVGGAGIEMELALLLETGIRVEPDVVLICFYLNDAQPSPGVGLVRIPPPLNYSRLAHYVLQSVAVIEAWAGGVPGDTDPKVVESWRREVRGRFPPGPGDPDRDLAAFHALVLDNVHDWGAAWSEGAWRRMRPVLFEMRRQADLRGIRLAIAALPARPQVTTEFVEDTPQRRLRGIAREMGVPVLDVLPALREDWTRSRVEQFYDVCHPTPHGSEVIARAIDEFLAKDVL